MQIQYKFFGLEYGSSRFYKTLEEFRLYLTETGKLKEEDTIFPVCGLISELKKSDDMFLRQVVADIKPTYKDEMIVLFLRRSDFQILHLMRAWPLKKKKQTPETQGNINVTDHATLMPRYSGFAKGKEPFTKELMRCLLITLERFMHLDDYYYPSIFKSLNVSSQSPTSRSIAIDDPEIGIKAKFKKLHEQDIRLAEEVVPTYKNVIRVVNEIINVRLRSVHDITFEKLLDDSFEPYNISGSSNSGKKLPDDISDPNELLDMVIRMSMVSISVLIYDHQLYELKKREGEGRESDEDIITKRKARITDYEKKIDELNHEIGQIYYHITNIKYDFINAVDRLRITPERAEAFREMYKEVLGDVSKITSMCVSRNPKKSLDEQMNDRLEGCNWIIFRSRIKKVSAAIVENISRLEDKIIDIKTPDVAVQSLLERHFENARVFTIMSSGMARDFVDIEKAYMDSMSAVLVRMPFVQEHSPQDRKTIELLIENLDVLVRSKRECELAYLEVVERIAGNKNKEAAAKMFKSLAKCDEALERMQEVISPKNWREKVSATLLRFSLNAGRGILNYMLHEREKQQAHR